MKKIVCALFLISLCFGCQKRGNEKKDIASRVAKLPILSGIRSLNPRISNEFPSAHVVNMIYEGLMHLDPEGNPTFGVAKSVDISEDQMTYTFHFRDSYWSNGDPVTAYDFEYAWKKAVNPKYAKTGAFTFYSIKNVAACLDKKVSVNEVGIRALDAKTLEVELEHPAPYFLYLTTCSTYSPINKKIDQDYPNWANNVGKFFVCNGPFILKKWRKGVELYLEKNEYYWDASSVKLPGIRLQIIPDASTQFFLFEKGEVDWVGEPFNPLPIDIVIGSSAESKVCKIDSLGLRWIFINTERPPFNNKNIRKALACGINRKEITDHIFQMGENPALGILNSDLALQEEPYFDDGNITEARHFFELGLKELGMSKEEIPPIVVSQYSSKLILRLSQAIQQQLFEALGVRVEIEQADFPVHFNKLEKGDFALGEISWTSWLRDPIYMLDTFRKRSFATNMSRWENEKYKECLEKSDMEIDPIKRKQYLQQAEKILMEEMPVIPISFHTLTFLKNPQFKGVYVSPLMELDLRYSYFEE